MHWKQPEASHESTFLTDKVTKKTTFCDSFGRSLTRVANIVTNSQSYTLADLNPLADTLPNPQPSTPHKFALFSSLNDKLFSNHKQQIQKPYLKSRSSTSLQQSRAHPGAPAQPASILASAIAGRIQPHQVLAMMTQIAAQLSYLHRMGSAHLDVKIDNICVDKLDQFTLIDYPDHVETNHQLTPTQVNKPTCVASTWDVCNLQPEHVLFRLTHQGLSTFLQGAPLSQQRLRQLSAIVQTVQLPSMHKHIANYSYAQTAYHDTWSLLFSAMLLTKHLDPAQEHIFIDAIFSCMQTMATTYTQLLSQDKPSHAYHKAMNAQFPVEATIHGVIAQIQARLAHVSPSYHAPQ